MSNSSVVDTLLHKKNAESLLWASFQRGEKSALDRLYKLYYPTLLSYGYNFCGERELTVDCIQDFFLYIWEHRENLGQVKSIQWYLISSFRRLLHRYVVKKRKRDYQKRDNYPIQNKAEYSIENILIQAEYDAIRSKLVQHMMNRLSDRQKEIVSLRYFKGLNPTEISNLLGIKYQTVVNHLTTAIKICQEDKESVKRYQVVYT